ncbi:MAG: tRNA-dihydrouridine synthase, partial [Pseudomonadota bacterium]
VMVGRGAQGAPWRLAQIQDALRGKKPRPEPTSEEFIDTACRHYAAAIEFYGETLGTRVIRKHLGWYMDAAETPATLRREILTAQTAADVMARLPDALSRRSLAA